MRESLRWRRYKCERMRESQTVIFTTDKRRRLRTEDDKVPVGREAEKEENIKIE